MVKSERLHLISAASAMPTVRFPSFLTNQFPVPAECVAEGSNLSELFDDLERRHPGLKSYLIDDQGALRQHVNVFISKELLRDRRKLTDAVEQRDEVFVMQALSGG